MKTPSWNGLKKMVDINYLDLGLALRRLREIHGLSRRYLANEVGISTYRLKKIEESKGADTDLLYTNLGFDEPLLKKIFKIICTH